MKRFKVKCQSKVIYGGEGEEERTKSINSVKISAKSIIVLKYYLNLFRFLNLILKK